MEGSNHFDTMQFFSQYGNFTNPNLSILAKMHGIDIPSTRIKGSEIENLYKEGKLGEIKDHCVEDVDILESLFKKSCLDYLENLKK